MKQCMMLSIHFEKDQLIVKIFGRLVWRLRGEILLEFFYEILGEIASLVATKTFTNEPVELPTDTFVVDLTREDSLNEEFCAVVEM